MHPVAAAAADTILAGSLPDWAMLLVVGLNSLVTGGFALIVLLRRSAGSAAAQSAELRALVKSSNKLAANQEKLDERQRAHELECAEFRGKILENYSAHASTSASVERKLEGICATLMRGLPPTALGGCPTTEESP